MRQLQQVMQNPQPREEEVRALMDTMERKKKEIEAVKQRQWEEQKALLTPVQQARYFFYVQNMMREARSVRSPAAPVAPKYPTGKAPEGVPVLRPNR
jgi:queuine/archaeosine tRNA-ribosyltransferase